MAMEWPNWHPKQIQILIHYKNFKLRQSLYIPIHHLSIIIIILISAILQGNNAQGKTLLQSLTKIFFNVYTITCSKICCCCCQTRTINWWMVFQLLSKWLFCFFASEMFREFQSNQAHFFLFVSLHKTNVCLSL